MIKQSLYHFRITHKIFFRGLLLGFISFLGALTFTVFFIAKTAYQKYQYFLESAQLTHSELLSMIVPTEKNTTPDLSTFLILGVDKVENRPDFPQLTDTNLLVRVNPKLADIKLLPLPRDLWNEPYKTKINAFYEYGRQQQPDNPTQFPQEIISEMTAQEIDHSIVVSLDQLAKIIDLIGCIAIDVKNGFNDEYFPRSDVDITVERDPVKLFETVEFKPGIQSMDSQTALKYIRSRNSINPEVGNDIARAERQQQVILAIVEKLSNPSLYWYEPQIAGGLFLLYKEDFDKYLPLTDLLSILRVLAPNAKNLSLNSTSLSIYPDDQTGVIEHPKNLSLYQQQWVYIVKDDKQFQDFITNFLSN